MHLYDRDLENLRRVRNRLICRAVALDELENPSDPESVEAEIYQLNDAVRGIAEAIGRLTLAKIEAEE